jgi:catechol 2,3-dioxygenase-like lactoylglutathione lyase family enzyme
VVADVADWKARGPTILWGCLMVGHDARVPELVPQLSRGKHRSPRKGACFMELASYLAGARWSDHPACTHPLLASLARLVNDHTSDAGRNELAGLVPSVIGLTSDDPHVDVRIALRAATTALPIAAADRQRVLAVAVLSAERVLDGLDGRPPGSLEDRSRWALAQVPDAADWAHSFTRENRTGSVRNFHRYAAPNTVRYAVVGIAHACVPDPDGILRDLLASAIADCAQLIRHAPPATTPDLAAWATACRLTGTAAGRHDQ